MPPLIWLLITLAPLLILERWIHRHLQGLILLLVRRPEVTLILYSLVFLPGVIVHEGSHWLMAKALGVRTGRFSVWPQRNRDGTLRLGYVETAKVDVFREAFIGAAPLMAGVALVSFFAYDRLGVATMGTALASGDLLAAFDGLVQATQRPDSWLWTYMIFAVSNAMMPSASDQRAWPWVVAAVAAAIGLLVYAGLGEALMEQLAGPVESVLRALAGAFSITILVNLLISPLIFLAERTVMRVTGFKVEY